ncbi:ciliogenesis-associated TTC17-interacting protein isoform X2 [Marmota monax]|uniref:ciliogenesis-associated TTC17-interacting protein isoform X2 n=1 Tax=Marmota monax TaxID=9995 RepID=UPI001EB01D11|nr:ciliogenesis-associated TTC17-interacting protein isoform X2 [Marmota monax]
MSSKVHSSGKDHRPSGQERQPLPEANAEAIDFLNSLQPEELQMLFFSETLAMVSDTGEPRGELTIEVQRGKYRDEMSIMSQCILVHAFSHGLLDKTVCGNSLLGYLSQTLETMEQHSREFIKFLILPMEHKMSLLKQNDQLAMTRSIKEGEEVKTGVAFFPLHSITGFISEAANLVLLRLMARRQKVPQNARFLALDTEGKLCYSTYQALGFQNIQVGHQQSEVFIVEHTVHSNEGIPMSWQFYMLCDGHLAKRIQVGSPGYCIITKMPILRKEDVIEPKPVFEKKPLEWEEDLELYSKFLERKVRSRSGQSGVPPPRAMNPPLPISLSLPPFPLPPLGSEPHTLGALLGAGGGSWRGSPAPTRASPPGGAATEPRQLPAAAPRGAGARLRLPALPAAAPAPGRGHLRRRVLRPFCGKPPALTALALLPQAQPFPLAGPGGRRGLGGGLGALGWRGPSGKRGRRGGAPRGRGLVPPRAGAPAQLRLLWE